MISINIPGKNRIQTKYLVLDYNGTLAIDGEIISGVKDILNDLSKVIDIHVVTADTFGRARDGLTGINCKLKILTGENQHIQKAEYIEEIGSSETIAIGNGLNDWLMLKNATIGIAVLQREGVSCVTIQNADILCVSIIDALELLRNPNRIVATLRL
jgi:P-type E1-E2 ATPase